MRHQDNVEQHEMELREVLDLALQFVGVFGPTRNVTSQPARPRLLRAESSTGLRELSTPAKGTF